MFKKMLSNSIILLLTTILIRGVIFAINFVCIKTLSIDDYGRFSLFRSTITTFEGILSGALGPYTVKKISEYQGVPPLKEILFLNLILVGGSSILLLCFSSFLYDKVKFSHNIFLFIFISILLLLSIKLFSFAQNVFIGTENYQKLLKLTVISTIINVPISSVLITNYQFIGALFSLALFYGIDSTLKIIYLNKKYNILQSNRSKFDYKGFGRNTGYLFAATSVSSIIFWLVRVHVSETSNGLIEIANFEVAFQFLTIIMILTGTTTSVLLPLLSKKENSIKVKRKSLFFNVIINIMILIILGWGIKLYGIQILSVFGETYSTAKNYDLLILVFYISIFFTLSSILNKVIIAKGCPKSVLTVNIVSSLLMLTYVYLEKSPTALTLGYGFLMFYISSFFLYFCLNLRLPNE